MNARRTLTYLILFVVLLALPIVARRVHFYGTPLEREEVVRPDVSKIDVPTPPASIFVDEEVVARLLNRAKEQGRADDTEEVIRRRMEVYAEQTAPLTDLYEQQGVLRKVDGMGSVEAVSERILAVLQS